jgi:Inner membrane protein YgaP-like, transmembrane domain
MTTNVGAIDRIVRIVLGIALIAFALGFIAPGAPYAWIAFGALASQERFRMRGL